MRVVKEVARASVCTNNQFLSTTLFKRTLVRMSRVSPMTQLSSTQLKDDRAHTFNVLDFRSLLHGKVNMTCTIVQTGLLSNWILESTLDNVVAANPLSSFRYVGLFQASIPNRRWSDRKPISMENASLDVGWRRMRQDSRGGG